MRVPKTSNCVAGLIKLRYVKWNRIMLSVHTKSAFAHGPSPLVFLGASTPGASTEWVVHCKYAHLLGV